MTQRYRHQVPVNSIWSQDALRRVPVTLPAPPWGKLDGDDRSATAPVSAPIRGNSTWQRDPILRHADTRRDRG